MKSDILGVSDFGARRETGARHRREPELAL
jgi:hypothetical protein